MVASTRLVSAAVQLSYKSNFAIASIAKEPVNSMNLALWQELGETLDKLEEDKNVLGVIWKSGLKRDVFTAGNDINELYVPNTSKDRFTEFWRVKNSFLARLFNTRLATVAAIRGASPAGGCIMSLCCDQRIITSNGSIGLNEVALGIPVPTVWGQVMGHVIGTYAAERMCVYAKMVKAEEAKRLGLVDQVIPSTSDSDLTAAAEEAIQAILKLPDASRALVKNDFRSRLGDILGDPKRIAQETENFWAVMNSPEVVKSLELVLARLSAKK